MVDLAEPNAITGKNHPQTSYAAASRARRASVPARLRVLAVLAVGNLTDEEIQTQLDMDPNTERPRRLELVERGYVVATSSRRTTRCGGKSIVWECTDAGRAALEQALTRLRYGCRP